MLCVVFEKWPIIIQNLTQLKIKLINQKLPKEKNKHPLKMTRMTNLVNKKKKIAIRVKIKNLIKILKINQIQTVRNKMKNQ